MFARLDTTPEAEQSTNKIPWRVIAGDIRLALDHIRRSSSLVVAHAASLISLTLHDRVVISRGPNVLHGVATQNGAMEGMLRQFMTAVMWQWLEYGYCLLRIASNKRFVVVPHENLDVKFQYRDDDELWVRVTDTRAHGVSEPDARIVKDVLCYVLEPPTEDGLVRSRFGQCLDSYARLMVLNRAAMRAWVTSSTASTVIQSVGTEGESEERRRDTVVLGDFTGVTQTRLTEARMVAMENARRENAELSRMMPASGDILRAAPALLGGGLTAMQRRGFEVLRALVDEGVSAADEQHAFHRVPTGFEAKQHSAAHDFPHHVTLLQQLSDEVRIVFGLPPQFGGASHKTNAGEELNMIHHRSTIQAHQAHLAVVGSVMLNFAHAPETFARLVKTLGKEDEVVGDEADEAAADADEADEGDRAPTRRRRGEVTKSFLDRERWAITFARTLHVNEVQVLYEMGALHGEEGARLLAATFGVPVSLLHAPPKPEPPAVPKAGAKGGV
jgi:hypothetical protein